MKFCAEIELRPDTLQMLIDRGVTLTEYLRLYTKHALDEKYGKDRYTVSYGEPVRSLESEALRFGHNDLAVRCEIWRMESEVGL